MAAQGRSRRRPTAASTAVAIVAATAWLSAAAAPVADGAASPCPNPTSVATCSRAVAIVLYRLRRSLSSLVTRSSSRFPLQFSPLNFPFHRLGAPQPVYLHRRLPCSCSRHPRPCRAQLHPRRPSPFRDLTSRLRMPPPLVAPTPCPGYVGAPVRITPPTSPGPHLTRAWARIRVHTHRRTHCSASAPLLCRTTPTSAPGSVHAPGTMPTCCLHSRQLPNPAPGTALTPTSRVRAPTPRNLAAFSPPTHLPAVRPSLPWPAKFRPTSAMPSPRVSRSPLVVSRALSLDHYSLTR